MYDTHRMYAIQVNGKVGRRLQQVWNMWPFNAFARPPDPAICRHDIYIFRTHEQHRNVKKGLAERIDLKCTFARTAWHVLTGINRGPIRIFSL